MTDHKAGTRQESLAARLNLAGQRVVVVGGTSGMGAATFRAARDLGADVVSAGRISHFEYQVLALLSEAPGRTLRMSALATLAEGSLPRLSQVVARLEQRGWVRRTPDPADGR